MKIRATRASLAWLVLLAACGGGGGGGSEGAVTPPGAPTLAVSFGYKLFRFTWAAVPTATSYRLSEDPDGASGYTVVATGLGTTNYDHALASLFGRINAKYKLEACNGGGCTASVPLNMPDNLSAALGAYVKASNTGGGDNFGSTVAISADGNTLAVGAPGEASAATGINNASPGQADDSASIAGAVYLFFRSGGAWSQQAYIKASNTNANDFFGFSVSLSGDGNTLAVGAVGEASAASGVNNTSPGQGDNSLIGAGAVYVFTRSGSAWSQQAYIKSLSPSQGDFFGFAIALNTDGSTLAVGAPFENSAATGVGGNNVSDCGGANLNCADNSGAVYVFTRSVTTWSEQVYLKASNTAAGDEFGWSVSLSGDGNLLAVGAPQEDSALNAVSTGAVTEGTAGNAATDAGAVYTFKRVNAVPPTWSQDTYVKASNAGAGDKFGTIVALSSDAKTLAVSAPSEDSATTGVSVTNPPPGNNDAATSAGAVYVFNRILTVPNSWAQQAYIKASNTASSAIFGVCMALSGDGNTLAVGAADAGDIPGIIPGSPDAATTHNAVGSSGAVYRFTRSGTVWQQQAYVKATNLEANDDFGVSVNGSGVIALSSDGSAMAVGAIHEASAATGIDNTVQGQGDNSAAGAGAVYLY